MTLHHEIAATLAPAIDCRAPYAKVMIARLVEIAEKAGNHHVAEIERLKVWVSELQSGGSDHCVYCGHRYGPISTTPVSMADILKAHIVQCPEHPMAKLVKELDVTAFVLEDAATVIEKIHPSLATVWMKKVEEARAALATAKATGAPP